MRPTALGRTALLSMLSLSWLGSAVWAAAVLQQRTCNTDSENSCIAADSSYPSPFSLRAATISSPRGGAALVHFQGSMLCSNMSTQPRVIDVITGLVRYTGGTIDQIPGPTLNGLGGARRAEVIVNSSIGTTVSFNLSTIVAVGLNAGDNLFFFRVRQLRWDPNVTCHFYNNTMSWVLTP